MLKANQDAERDAKNPAARAGRVAWARQGVPGAVPRISPGRRPAVQVHDGAQRALMARAAEELRLALAKSPDDFNILLAAAENELQRGDVAKARAYFDRIPRRPREARSDRDMMQLRIVQGMIDLAENRPDEAIESWQEGLVATGGTNADLTWQLAYIQLEMGRLAEAEPLIQQHRRLTGGASRPPSTATSKG